NLSDIVPCVLVGARFFGIWLSFDVWLEPLRGYKSLGVHGVRHGISSVLVVYAFLQFYVLASALWVSCACGREFLDTLRSSPPTIPTPNNLAPRMRNDPITTAGILRVSSEGNFFVFPCFILQFDHAIQNFSETNSLPMFRTDCQTRMLDSAHNFALGFFRYPLEGQYQQEIMIGAKGINNTLAPYRFCPNNDIPNIGYRGAPLTDAWNAVYLRDTVPRLQRYVDGFELDVRDVYAMQELCAYETVALGYSKSCELFTEKGGKALIIPVQNSATTSTVPSSYAVPGAFPTSLYPNYYNNPTATSAQPQPVISDPVTHEIFPFSLTDPQNIPQNDTVDPHPLPPQASSQQLLQQAVAQIKSIAVNPMFTTSCARCQASLEVAKFLAFAAPEQGTNLALTLCEYFDYSSSCEKNYGPLVLGPILTQVASFADVGGYDGQSICSEFLGLCSAPTTTTLILTGWFAKPKPNPLPPPKQPSGQLMKVLHLSDLHIDSPWGSPIARAQGIGYVRELVSRLTQTPIERTIVPLMRHFITLSLSPLETAFMWTQHMKL
ncbi:hypothetical protein C8R48DRAFT_793164, partial [Suillus tomentosus]